MGWLAVVAEAAVLVQLLAEVVQQLPAAAHRRLGVVGHLGQQLVGVVALGHRLVLAELFQLENVVVAVEHQAVAFQAVAAAAAGFLVVALDGLGRVVVNHEAHVGLVDAHAEGDGGHNHVALLVQERVLVVDAHLLVEAGVVGAGAHVVHAQQLGNFLHLLAAQAVNDAGLALVLLHVLNQLLFGVVLGAHLVVEIGAVEAGFEDAGVVHVQVFLDVQLHFGRGRGREGNNGHVAAQVVDDAANLAVLGPEVVAPLRDAVGLVDGHEADGAFQQELDGVVLGQAFGGHVEQAYFAAHHVFLHPLHLRFGQGRIIHLRIHAEGPELVDLVFHQGDEGRNNDGRARHHQGRQLVAQAFARAGGHNHEGVVPGQHVLNNSLLRAPKLAVAEYFFKCMFQIGRQGRGFLEGSGRHA